jgi:predicted O-methyltransferase YrrM
MGEIRYAKEELQEVIARLREKNDKSINEIFKLTRDEAYSYFHQGFHHASPTWLKDHRSFFSEESRSFGEDAFHSMWLHIFKEFRPKIIIEIGVYRGSTISLFSLISKQLNYNSEIHGISPFAPIGDSVSKYLSDLDYELDVENNFKFFELNSPILHKGLSQEPSMIEVMNSKKWDLIFIDGNHDEDVVDLDFKAALKNLNTNGIIVLDDSALYTEYTKLSYSTTGHPGPSNVANRYLDKNIIKEVIACGHNRAFQKL